VVIHGIIQEDCFLGNLGAMTTPALRYSFRRLKKYPDNHREVSLGGGVKGMLPLDYLPLWGREGVTLIILKQNDNGESGFFIIKVLYEVIF